jgi:sugar O-acyltransferase (sialic acid O-acetyltransferase NeuD family)
MTEAGQQVVIVGDGEFGQIAYEYLTHDSPHTVVAFSAERAFLKRETLYELPVVPFEELETHYPPDRYRVLVAITYTKLNRVRARLYRVVKQKGFAPISYVSSRAFVWQNAEIGENCFIFENNVVQFHTRIGNNVVLWSGNHIGHRASIGDHSYLSSHVVVSGYCEIGQSCFFGVNSAVADRVKVADDCVIAAGTVITRDTEAGKVYKMEGDAKARASSLALFRVRPGDQ